MTTTLSTERVEPRPTVPQVWLGPSEKVQGWHRDRLALVYVRQSTPQQVHDHQESTRLQYGLTSRAQELGWAEARVVVIDDDLGKSGASADGRPGFQRLVTEVSLDHVGLILGVEMSRLARSGKDWHQLLELCALFRTLIADLDGVYDPGAYNDRLLLGLKGTMSEAELHILKQRMYQGRLNQLAEPENRLVVRQLERAWEEQLAAQEQLDQAHQRFAREQPRLLSPTEQATIRRLSADIPALWEAPTTTDADRKAIVRQIVERVTVAVQGESERVAVTITWAGGAHTTDEIIRPVARLEQLSYYPRLVERLHALAADGLSLATIAQRLNEEGFRPPKRRERFGAHGVQELLRRLGRRPPHQARTAPLGGPDDGLGEHEWWLADLAQAIEMPPVTLFTWIKRGWVTGRQEAQPPRRWILRADDAELEQLRERHRRPTSYYTRRPWVEAP